MEDDVSEVDRIWNELDMLQARINKELALMQKRLDSIEKSIKETNEQLETASRKSVNRDPFVSRGGSISV